MSLEVEVFLVGNERLDSVLADSPCLRQYLINSGVQLRPYPWCGQLPRFPTQRHALVHCSDNIAGTVRDLQRACVNGGHVLFYSDKLITLLGRLDFPELAKATKELIQLRKHLYPVST
ncbi:hypothetical protein KJ611_02835 [Patescibacteria group bacterium]|nr:hypothetical protein [Patescibacteria group bacterium]MBU1705218.1 hypothetical protein [Patescibacteria group bacterium]